MITIRKAKDQRHFDFGWLDTYHTFAFGDYYDPEFMGFRSLRVINEDRVAPQTGFPPMDIGTWRLLPMCLRVRSIIATAWVTAPRFARVKCSG